ncbi:MAG TPA: DUF6457 domain-containing protein [Phycicoccus sp.]|jgi:hypothetical protein|nr:DUF6457 domain-containing protein [Phycicoccus sp.]HQK31818.1 DUF6457 domain-containing protein [Phycicoccus sp.]HQV90696.1 DUF6457 domain-containing protein [Phycicoccus sp.]HRA46080.1 DUF6457 domain-containing protein [Phycicoccus sp.]
MTDLVAAEATWHDWIVEACAALDVDPDLVDVKAIHGLTKRIAHEYERPMAPVGAYILGLAVGAGAGPDRITELRATLESTIHGRTSP